MLIRGLFKIWNRCRKFWWIGRFWEDNERLVLGEEIKWESRSYWSFGIVFLKLFGDNFMVISDRFIFFRDSFIMFRYS